MAQRITNKMMVSNYNRNQNEANVRMERLQTQLASNRKLVRLSDDPVNTVKSLTARSRLNDIEQYQKNLSDARAWLTQTETALTEMNDIVKRVYELAVYAANDVMTNDDRDAVSKEIRELRDQVETLANSTLGDKYIFGGYNVSSAPFTALPEENNILYNGESMADEDVDLDYTKYEINFGVDFDIAITAAAFLGVGKDVNDKDKNIYIILNEMYNTLNTGSELNEEGLDILHENIKPFIERMDTAQKRVLTQLSEVGGRSARVEMMQERYANDNINYTQMKSDVEDLDQAEAIMWFSMAESVYRASLSVGGRILTPSLLDFLK